MRNPIICLLHYGSHKPFGSTGAGLGRCMQQREMLFFFFQLVAYEVKDIKFVSMLPVTLIFLVF